MTKGTFCISIDTEMLWGRWDLDYTSFISKTKKEREIIKDLLKLFDKYKISVTWAIVGELLNKNNNSPNSNLWHAPDIINTIRKFKYHEIGSHSYSHIYFDRIGKNEAEEDFRRFHKVSEKENIRPKSFVFPRNAVGYTDLLKKYNYLCFRGPDKKWFSGVGQYQSRLGKFLEILDFILVVPNVHTPTFNNGVLNIPGSMYFVSSRGIRKYIPKNVRFLCAKRGIDRAIKEGKVFHLWFHPVDFVDESSSMFDLLERILIYVQSKVNQGKLKVLTMESIALGFRKSQD